MEISSMSPKLLLYATICQVRYSSLPYFGTLWDNLSHLLSLD